MRVCLLSGTWPPRRCGVGDHAQSLSRALAAVGGKAWEVGEFAGQGSWRLWDLPGLCRGILEQRPDILHLQYPTAAYGRGLAPNLVFLFLRLLKPRLRCVLTLHEYRQYSWLGKLRLWPAVAWSHAVICTNHADRRAIQDWQRGSRRKVCVIPLGSNVGHADLRSFKWLASPDGRQWLAHFGTVMPNKGWELLLEALARLTAAGLPIGLLVVGALEPGRYAYHARVAEWIQAKGLSGRVIFSGYLPAADVGHRLQESCGIAIQPYAGGASLNRSSLAAVLAQGLAVLTTRPGRPLEGLAHGRNIWYVEETAEALAQGVRQLLVEPGRVARLQAGAVEAARRFAWPKIAERTLKVYQKLCQAEPTPAGLVSSPTQETPGLPGDEC